MVFRVAQDIVEEFHRRHSTSYRMWEYHAATLRYAAEVLFRQAFADTAVRLQHRRRKALRPLLDGPGYMLAGMMVEAAAKAVLVSRSAHLSSRDLRRHDLVKIVKATGYVPAPVERDLLRRLTAFVRWAGRYPVPLKPDEMAVNSADGGRHLVGGGVLGSDLRGARQIADKLEAMLPGDRIRRGMRLPSGAATVNPWRRRPR